MASDKKSENLLDVAAKYKHLMRPFYSIMHVPSDDSHAPSGKWALSKNRALNLGLWNALGVASWVIPTAALASYFANKWWDKKMREASKDARLSRTAAVAPVLTPDADLNYIANVIESHKKEDEAVSTLLKQSNEREDKSIKGGLRRWFGGVAAASLPIAAVPLSMLAAKLAVDKLYAKSMKQELNDELTAVRNLQNSVDYRTMLVQGLLKNQNTNTIAATEGNNLTKESSIDTKVRLTKEDAINEIARRDKKEQDERGIVNHYFSWPILAALLGGGALAMLSFKYLRDHDKDAKTLEYIKKKSLGHNVMQTTPEIGLEQFGIPVDQIIARPGDKSQPIYELAEAAKAAEAGAPLLPNQETAISSDVLADLDEVVAKNNTETKKSDALF